MIAGAQVEADNGLLVLFNLGNVLELHGRLEIYGSLSVHSAQSAQECRASSIRKSLICIRFGSSSGKSLPRCLNPELSASLADGSAM